jgi:hypothetical protein
MASWLHPDFDDLSIGYGQAYDKQGGWQALRKK